MTIGISKITSKNLISLFSSWKVFENGTSMQSETLKSLVDSVKVGGCTNLQSGLELGATVFTESNLDVRKLFLFRFSS
jgi:hypothetical protein